MLSRQIEKKLVVKDCEKRECFEPFDLEYYLLESEIDDGELAGMTAYGIEIVKIVGQAPVENAIVKNYTCSREAAHDLLCKLAENVVTPVSLEYIMDDIVGV
jgi:hypothetical protein